MESEAFRCCTTVRRTLSLQTARWHEPGGAGHARRGCARAWRASEASGGPRRACSAQPGGLDPTTGQKAGGPVPNGTGPPDVNWLLRDRGDAPRTNGAAALTDREPETFLHGDRLDQLDRHVGVVTGHDHLG